MYLKTIVGAICLFFVVQAGAQTVFVPGTEDVPLADGLVLMAGEEDVSFDTPAGQILMVQARVQNGTPADIWAFYDKTLPALGWRLIRAGLFERDGEMLKISVSDEKLPEVQFELTPRDF